MFQATSPDTRIYAPTYNMRTLRTCTLGRTHRARVHAHTRACARAHTHSRVHTRTRARARTHTRTDARTHAHTPNTHTHTRARAHLHTHTHTHTHAGQWPLVSSEQLVASAQRRADAQVRSPQCRRRAKPNRSKNIDLFMIAVPERCAAAEFGTAVSLRCLSDARLRSERCGGRCVCDRRRRCKRAGPKRTQPSARCGRRVRSFAPFRLRTAPLIRVVVASSLLPSWLQRDVAATTGASAEAGGQAHAAGSTTLYLSTLTSPWHYYRCNYPSAPEYDQYQ
jgi:hypothetical protein